jgi:WD40 repeat protein
MKKREGIFISYARKDGEPSATEIRRCLADEQFKLWQDRVSLEGGREWWFQITEALDNVEFMILVVTRGTLESTIVRKEWRYARQQGVCVYLVKADPALDFKALPRWMSDQQIYDLSDPLEQEKLISDLKKTPELKRVPFMVEDLPADFVQRRDEFEQLINLLLDQNRENPIAITAALRGAGGYGKTTLAKAICHDERIQDAFDDGILWVTLGENPGDLNAKVLELIEVLSDRKPDYTGAEAVATRFRELLADRDILLVIDDVWNQAHLRHFTQGGERCARLITTRTPQTLPEKAAEVKVDAMREAEAVALLAAGLDQKYGRPTARTLQTLAARLGEWPLLLKLANGVLRNRLKSGDTLPAAIVYANRALDRRGLKAFDADKPIERNQAAEMTLRVSLDQLATEDRQRFSELAIFPEDVAIPLATLEKYWGLDDLDTEDACTRLDQLSLLLSFDLGPRTIRLHDVARTFLRGERKADLTALNNQLLDAHRPADGWSAMADKEPYLWKHLAEHLIEADRGAELAATVKDWRYLATKTLLNKACFTELDLLAALGHLPHDAELQSLRRNFARSNHLLDRCANLNDLAGTLHSRLQHLGELASLAEAWERNAPRPFLTARCHLPDHPVKALIRTMAGHSDAVWACTISPDGAIIVSASYDQTLKVWDARSGGELFTLAGHTASVNGCAISADASTIVSASSDETLKVWDARSGAERFTLRGHSAAVNGCAISADCSTIFSTSADKTLKIWDAQTGVELSTLTGHSDSVFGCAISADGSTLVSASYDQTLKAWDVRAGAERFTLAGHSANVQGCAISADGSTAVSASFDKTLKVWSATGGGEQLTLAGHAAPVLGCAISANGSVIASASRDKTLRIWDAHTGDLQHTLAGHSDVVWGCAMTDDGSTIITASGDRTLKVWNAQAPVESQILSGHSAAVLDCAISDDGSTIISASDDRTLKVWDTLTGSQQFTLSGHKASVWGCAISADGSTVVSASKDRTLKIWDARTGIEKAAFPAHSAAVLGCAISADGSIIVSASRDRTLKIWDTQSGSPQSILTGHLEAVWDCGISADGSVIVSASSDHTLKIWDARAGTQMFTLTGHSDWVRGCAISADGSTIVSASQDRTLKVWDAQTGRERFTLSGHSDFVWGCEISADGSIIVSASRDRTVGIWDAQSGRCLTRLIVDGELNACACSANGQTIVAVGERGVYFLRLVR